MGGRAGGGIGEGQAINPLDVTTLLQIFSIKYSTSI